MNYEFNIFYYISIYKKWWKMIVLVISISMFLTMCSSLRKPVTYVSTATLLSTEGGASVSSLGRFLGIPDLSVGPSSNEIVTSVLKSRRMAKDINDKFKPKQKSNFWWGIDTFRMTGGLGVEVKGSDPALTEKIANFAIQNLDTINAELNITPNKPMVKVLDPATYGSRRSRQIPRKMLLAGILAFLVTSLYAFFSDYLKKLKSQ